MLGAGKKTRQWNATRAKLKVRFERAGITRCEFPMEVHDGMSCGSTFAMSFAHRFKRRNITTQEELETCALLCERHHSGLELLKEAEMRARITDIIAARETPV